MHLDAFTISSKTLRERSPRDSGSSTPKSLPQGRTDLYLQSAWSFQFYTFLEDFVLWFPEFPLVVIMFDCWLVVATVSFDCGSQVAIQFWLFLSPRQTWYLSDALWLTCSYQIVGLGIFISTSLIFWWILVIYQNLEKVCKYLCKSESSSNYLLSCQFMLLVCLDGWCELVAGSLSQLQHSTGKTGLPLNRERLDIKM